jgi:nucleotide-binding universal stress UspA family protein
MFKNILVPLDGSRLAETALPPAAAFAEKFGAHVTLVHIIEQDAPSEVHRDRHLTEAGEAKIYLDELARRAFPSTVKVTSHVHTANVENVAQGIVEHSNELESCLIVLCSHGNGGMRDLLFGNIAQQVVARGVSPVLLVKPGEKMESFNLNRILVPLDIESVHDRSLPISEELAHKFAAELYLITVVPTFGTLSGERAAAGSMMPTTTTALLDMEEENARSHLMEHQENLRASGLHVSSEVARGDPATVIVKTAGRTESGLILLCTHRKAGIDAFWARSVAPKVANKSTIPLLLIPLD